ncbi:MAG: hypothetical protein P1V29_05740 [Gammaproteobacteria bacterium]|jgi:hypothetical protein|nr:hypothetical protein [Gammaproteobacteria bacterium]
MSSTTNPNTEHAPSFGSYPRTTIAVISLALLLAFSFSSLRGDTWVGLLSFFEWMETTWFGYVGKTWGGAFALIQAAHLVSLGVLGGAVLFSDGRLLGLFSSLPIRDVVDGAHRVFVWALAVVVGTGVFMVCGVAVKVYYLPVFWYKMLTLAVGVLFALFIRKPLVDREISEVNPKIVKLVAVASIMVWFTVAATGRWIGFS